MSPRFDVKIGDYENWINKLMPSHQFGIMVLTTSAGIMDHHEAKKRHLGGKLLGYFY